MTHELICKASAAEQKRIIHNARNLVALYRDRNNGVAANLFHDPAWIVLLQLYISTHKGKQFSILDAVDISLVPPTTAVRYVKNLQRCELVEQCLGDDGRLTANLKLTQAGYDLVSNLLARIS